METKGLAVSRVARRAKRQAHYSPRAVPLSRATSFSINSLRSVRWQCIASVQAEFADRAAKIRRDIAWTQEFMRFGAIMGRVVDADGSILDDFWQSWGVGDRKSVV